MPVIDLARRFEDAGVASLLFTDVGRDGMLTGCNIEATWIWHARCKSR
jgi:phosphoribosylformimino-5-aminoimidazole carboxamide ribotide isomerase